MIRAEFKLASIHCQEAQVFDGKEYIAEKRTLQFNFTFGDVGKGLTQTISTGTLLCEVVGDPNLWSQFELGKRYCVEVRPADIKGE